jgi:hypothetical protein
MSTFLTVSLSSRERRWLVGPLEETFFLAVPYKALKMFLVLAILTKS